MASSSHCFERSWFERMTAENLRSRCAVACNSLLADCLKGLRCCAITYCHLLYYIL